MVDLINSYNSCTWLLLAISLKYYSFVTHCLNNALARVIKPKITVYRNNHQHRPVQGDTHNCMSALLSALHSCRISSASSTCDNVTFWNKKLRSNTSTTYTTKQHQYAFDSITWHHTTLRTRFLITEGVTQHEIISKLSILPLITIHFLTKYAPPL